MSYFRPFINQSLAHISPPFGGRYFWRIEGDGASRFTAFFADMALVTCYVWRATRHACDGTLGELGRLPRKVHRLGRAYLRFLNCHCYCVRRYALRDKCVFHIMSHNVSNKGTRRSA